jgi:starch phosphorylase
MRLLCPQFSCNRMLHEYTERFYLPAARHGARLTANNLERARQLAHWKRNLEQHWSQVRFESLAAQAESSPSVGQGLEVRAGVRLGAIDPTDVTIELYYGIEQIGWTARSKPYAMYYRRFEESPKLPQMSEAMEVVMEFVKPLVERERTSPLGYSFLSTASWEWVGTDCQHHRL